MSRKNLLSLAAFGLFVALGVAAPVGIDLASGDITVQSAEARRGRGADDGANHDVGDDRGGSTTTGTSSGRRGRGRGADDGINHDADDDSVTGIDSGDQRRRGRGR